MISIIGKNSSHKKEKEHTTNLNYKSLIYTLIKSFDRTAISYNWKKNQVKSSQQLNKTFGFGFVKDCCEEPSNF